MTETELMEASGLIKRVKPLTEKQARTLRMYQDGMTPQDIAHREKVTPKSIYERLAWSGVEHFIKYLKPQQRESVRAMGIAKPPKPPKVRIYNIQENTLAERITAALREQPGLRVREICAMANERQRIVAPMLSHMVKDGVLERVQHQYFLVEGGTRDTTEAA